MTERAQVLEINNGTAKVACFDDAGCDSCSSMFCGTQTRTFSAAIEPDMHVKTGDQVEIFVPPTGAIGAGFLVLIVPLLLFVAAYLAFGFVESEPIQVGAGLGGLFAGFGLVYLLGRGKTGNLPRITRVFTADELIPAGIQDPTV